MGAQSEVADTYWDWMAIFCAVPLVIVPALCVAAVWLLH